MMDVPTSAMHRFTMVLFSAAFLLVPAHSARTAVRVDGPLVSSGGVTAENGSLLNVGQPGVGLSRSNTHTMRAGGLPVIQHVQLSLLPTGDIDSDGDVDLVDAGLFVLCMNGPEVSLPPRGCTSEMFGRADLQADEDVDLGDFGEFSLVFMGKPAR